MKIAIDLNDVLRDYTRNFAKYYKRGYNRSFDLDSVELTTNSVYDLFPFETRDDFNRFVYEDYTFELYGRCDTVTKHTPASLNEWIYKIVENIDTEEDIELLIVSPFEYGLTIQSTYFFLSKIGCKIRETYFPEDSFDIWNKCDVLITANPELLNNKPEDKISVKINMEYNKDCKSDFDYDSFDEFSSEIDFTEGLLNKFEKYA